MEIQGEWVDPKDIRECECCKCLDDIQFMHNKPEGYYCESCYAAIFE